jgi:hypothetical protein
MRYTIYLLVFTIFFFSCKANDAVPANTRIDSIVVKKSKHEMYVFQHHQLLKTYKIALGRQPIGHKQVQGDNRTPEELYRIFDKTRIACAIKTWAYHTRTMQTGRQHVNWANHQVAMLKYTAYPTDKAILAAFMTGLMVA